MQLFTKKISGSSKGGFPAWHPNFRNKTELPDIKAVRTKFFVNALAAMAGISSMLAYLYQEYSIKEARYQMSVLQQQLDASKKPSIDAVATYKNFLAEESRVKELLLFTGSERLVLSDFVIAVGKRLPPEVVINSIQYRQGDVLLGGIVKGAPELASGVASMFEKQLKEAADINTKFKTISLTSLTRDPKTEFLNFLISLEFRK